MGLRVPAQPRSQRHCVILVDFIGDDDPRGHAVVSPGLVSGLRVQGSGSRDEGCHAKKIDSG